MKYISILAENAEYWMELDEELYALRQIIIENDSNVHASCRGDYLAEGAVIADELDGAYREVTQEKFEDVWSLAVERHRSKWSYTKIKYPVGSIVQGVCQYFYPQGMIVEGNDFTAVYRGEAAVLCREALTAQVAGYDEVNMWLVLE